MQPQPPQRQLSHVQMAGMGRIERAAEQPDPDPARIAKPRQRVRGIGQGRTWPVPMTR